MKDTAADEIYVNDYDLAKWVSGNSLRFIDRQAWDLVDAARKYIAAESFNRRHCFGMITAPSPTGRGKSGPRSWTRTAQDRPAICTPDRLEEA
jgi:hypothetical protein